MKSSVVFSVLALALTSQACDTYKYCHCTNADGTPNSDATLTVCGNDPYVYDNGYAECNHYDNYFWVVKAINNCDFRKACNRNGAPGDSSCRAKVGVFRA
ncbi:hypothetical protein CaCOL14_007353 [Colletotrichum acutatum]